VSSEPGIDVARLGRTLALVGFVTAVFLLLAVNRLSGDILRVGIVGIGAVAFFTAISGFLIAAASTFDDDGL
jgi:ABC-type enterobactin transport system permease subunit